MITVYIYRSASCHRSVFHCFEDWKMSQKCTISTLQAIKNAIMGWSWPIDVNRNHLTIQKLNFWVYGTWRNSCKQMLFDNGIKWLGSLCIGAPLVNGKLTLITLQLQKYLPFPPSWLLIVKFGLRNMCNSNVLMEFLPLVIWMLLYNFSDLTKTQNGN